MLRTLVTLGAGLLLLHSIVPALDAQEARRRWDRMCQIRKEKFDLILPEVMRENQIDMWIVMQKEGHNDPLYEDLGRGYTGSIGYYIFTDRGDNRIERIASGVGGRMLEACLTYDMVGSVDLATFVAERDPTRIGVNMSHQIGAADGLSHSSYLHLVETLGPRFADRIVSAEKLVSDFRSRRVASEIVAFGEAGEWSRRIAERAFSNEIITPGVTALEDVAWWMWDQLLANGFGSSFDMPSVYITGPTGIEASSTERIIQRGDLLMIDWGVGYLNFLYGYETHSVRVLREGETEAPPGIQNAFNRAIHVRRSHQKNHPARPNGSSELRRDQRPHQRGARLRHHDRVQSTHRTPTDTEVIVGSHSVGNTGTWNRTVHRVF